jgi:hypothetical protein
VLAAISQSLVIDLVVTDLAWSSWCITSFIYVIKLCCVSTALWDLIRACNHSELIPITQEWGNVFSCTLYVFDLLYINSRGTGTIIKVGSSKLKISTHKMTEQHVSNTCKTFTGYWKINMCRTLMSSGNTTSTMMCMGQLCISSWKVWIFFHVGDRKSWRL